MCWRCVKQSNTLIATNLHWQPMCELHPKIRAPSRTPLGAIQGPLGCLPAKVLAGWEWWRSSSGRLLVIQLASGGWPGDRGYGLAGSHKTAFLATTSAAISEVDEWDRLETTLPRLGDGRELGQA